MKKFRMMLPMVAFVFAVVGAVAGNFLPPITQGYYKDTPTSCFQQLKNLDQANCQTGLVGKPVCTINMVGHPQAYADPNCVDVLRYNPN